MELGFFEPIRNTGVSPVLAIQDNSNPVFFAFIRVHSCQFVDNRI